MGSWTAVEYAVHRFVLHGLQPFRRWHLMHHKQPPTLLSATLIASLVFPPTLLLGSLWRACALTLGVLIGYVAYGITHHSIHHWRTNNAWLRERKRWHVLHHYNIGRLGHFGVSTTFRDRVFGDRILNRIQLRSAVGALTSPNRMTGESRCKLE